MSNGESSMRDDSNQQESFEDAAHKLYGCLAQAILVFVLITNILAYAFSAKYRATFPLGKFIICTLAWSVLTGGLWWMRRDVRRGK